MKQKSAHTITLAALLCVVLPQAAAAQATRSLSNDYLRAEFSADHLTSLVDRASGFRALFRNETFSLTIGGEKLDPSGLKLNNTQLTDTNITYIYNSLRYTLHVIYELRPGRRFLTKQIVIHPAGAGDYRVNEVEAFRGVMQPTPAGEMPIPPPPSRTSGNWGNLLRYVRDPRNSVVPDFGMFFLYQNPFFVWRKEGVIRSASYLPEIDWKSGYGPHASDRLCIGLYPLSGRVFPATAVPEWTFVADYRSYLAGVPQIDTAEADALVACVRSFLIYRPQRSVRVHVPWCENDYQIDVADPEGWEEFQRIIDRAVEVGCQYTLFTPANSEVSSLKENRDAWGWENLLFFGMGQKIRKDEWNPARDPIPPSLGRTLDYAKSKNIRLVSYSYPSLPFLQDPEWTRWAGAKVGGYNGPDMGLRTFQDWWLDKLEDFVKATGAGGYSFDHWWIAYDNASSRYSQWNGCRRILETLRRRIPGILIDGRQQYMSFGPWTWLAGTYPHPSLTDEQPESFNSFPDLHTDRVSANRQRYAAWTYRMQRFCPPEILPGFITHQTERNDARKVMRRDRFRPRDWDLLGWKFSVLSSIGTAPFNHVVDYLPARDPDEFRSFSAADARWFREWFDWSDRNAEVLRNIKPILGPPMIGQPDGTAAIAGDHGFVFLFNPNYRGLEAQFSLDRSIGLERGSRFVVEQLHPEKGMLIGNPSNGYWSIGDRVVCPLAGNEAVVLEIRPAGSGPDKPLLFGARGSAALSGDKLILSGVSGEVGTSRDILVRLPGDRKIGSMTANDIPVKYRQNGRTVSARIRFAGDAFTRSQPLWRYDPSFTGGSVRASFRVPDRILEQLRRRKQEWPVPYTEDDLIATWLGSYRLLLYAHIAEPNEALELTMTIDGAPLQVYKAYNSIYPTSGRTFLGFYADVSSLDRGKEHVLEVVLPRLPAGRFQGLFFENIEPEYTQVVVQ